MPSLLRSHARRFGGVSLAASAAVLLSGCYGITSQEAAQIDVNGDVQVTTSLCLSGVSPEGVQNDQGCTVSDPHSSASPMQLFVSYLVPNGYDDPQVGHATGALSAVTFTKATDEQNDAISADADEKSEHPEGFHWVTYASSPTLTLPASGSASVSEVEPAPSTPGPYEGTIRATFDTDDTFQDLKLRTATSWRWVNDASTVEPDPAYAIDRPIECGSLSSPSRTPATECGYSISPTPTPRPIEEEEATTESVDAPAATTPDGFFLYPTTRLVVLGPQSGGDTLPTFTAGTTARVPFGQISALAPGAPVATVPVSGSSDVPGAVATTIDRLTIGSESDLSVDLALPAATPAGDYKVAVAAGERTGHREAWQLIHVNAAPPAPQTVPGAPAPIAAPAAPTVGQLLVTGATKAAAKLEEPKKTRPLRKGAVTVPFEVPAKGLVRVSVLGEAKGKKKAPVLAVGEAESKGAGPVNVKLKRTTEGKRLFASGKPITGTIVVRFWGPGGKTVSTGVEVEID